MQSKVYDLGTIRLDDVALIISDEVRYYERAMSYTHYIIDDECVRLINYNRRRMTRHRLIAARKVQEALNDPESQYYDMTTFDATRRLAEAAEWYGRCIELVTHFVHLDREATIANIKLENARREARGYED
jgi:hypothetical protein